MYSFFFCYCLFKYLYLSLISTKRSKSFSPKDNSINHKASFARAGPVITCVSKPIWHQSRFPLNLNTSRPDNYLLVLHNCKHGLCAHHPCGKNCSFSFSSPSDKIILCRLHLLFEHLPLGLDLGIRDTSMKNMVPSFSDVTFWG